MSAALTKRVFAIVFSAILVCLTATEGVAQRKVTPVQPARQTAQKLSTKKKQEIDRSRLAERLDAEGNVVLVDTVTGLEFVDSTAMKPDTRNIYPLMHAVTVGVNVWDPAMRALGQHYGGIDFWGELSLHNRFKPIVVIGTGSCDYSPDNSNFTFKSKLAPYFKLGINYNVFYNSSPDYQFCVGMRYGFTTFDYEVTSVSVDDPYWNEESHFSIPSQKSTTGYLEITGGIKVKIVKNISMGWTLKYHSIIHETNAVYGKPMYIPGFGKRGNALGGEFSIMYTLPLNNKTVKSVDTKEGNAQQDIK